MRKLKVLVGLLGISVLISGCFLVNKKEEVKVEEPKTEILVEPPKEEKAPEAEKVVFNFESVKAMNKDKFSKKTFASLPSEVLVNSETLEAVEYKLEDSSLVLTFEKGVEKPFSALLIKDGKETSIFNTKAVNDLETEKGTH